MELFWNLDDIAAPFDNACVTIGNFDGVHLGHQQLFSKVGEKAGFSGGCSVVVTFDPHPLTVLRPGGIKLISTIAQKIEQIDKAGIDILIIIPFDRSFAATTAEQFVQDLLIETIGMRELVVGYDYAFGKGRSGDTRFLKEQGQIKGFPVTVVEAFYHNDMLVSSTQIRNLVTEGRMMDSRLLLGRPYQIRGAVQVISEGKCYGGVLNIGYNPTFGDEKLVAETHIFDFNKDIYGKPIKLNLLKFVRDERKFAGIADLAEQIEKDVVQAKKILSENREELTISCNADEDTTF